MNEAVVLGLIFALFSTGVYCIAVKRNMIRILLGIEIMLNSGNLAFIYFASLRSGRGFIDPLGQSIVIMSIIIGGCVVAVGLSLVVNAYRHFKTMDVRKLRRLKW